MPLRPSFRAATRFAGVRRSALALLVMSMGVLSSTSLVTAEPPRLGIYVAPGGFGDVHVSLPNQHHHERVGPSIGGGLSLVVPVGHATPWAIGGALESHVSWRDGTRQFLSERILAFGQAGIPLGGRAVEVRYVVRLLLGAQWFDPASVVPPGSARLGFVGGARMGFEVAPRGSRARYYLHTGVDAQWARPAIANYDNGVDARSVTASTWVTRGIVIAGVEFDLGTPTTEE